MGKVKEDPDPTGKEGDGGISGFTHTRSIGAHGFNECCALLQWPMSGKALHDILMIRLSVRLVAVCCKPKDHGCYFYYLGMVG